MAINFSIQILSALGFVHQQKIIHRDIKPSNIMILPSGHCFIIDFSIGFKLITEEDITRATLTGDHLGSVNYMSPEQKINMKEVDQRTDLYSYSLVLCEMLSGRPDTEILKSIKNKIPEALIRIIKKGCNYDLNERYFTADEYIRDLKQISSTTTRILDNPSKAVCINLKCPSANWSPSGYYRGAYFIEESVQSFCTECGNKLIYQCEHCGNQITNTRFCGGCGTQQFEIPECKQCGSYLKKQDMYTDTEKNGCDRCRKEKEASAKNPPTPQPNFEDFDDDIPF